MRPEQNGVLVVSVLPLGELAIVYLLCASSSVFSICLGNCLLASGLPTGIYAATRGSHCSASAQPPPPALPTACPATLSHPPLLNPPARPPRRRCSRPHPGG